MLNQTKLKEG